MKRMIMISLIAIYLLAGSFCPAEAAEGVSITVVTDLEFGRVYMGSPEQDVSPASSRAAQILVEADSSQDLGYQVEVGWFWGFFNFTFLENQDGAGSLLVSDLRSSLTNDQGTITNGEDTFGIGGTLEAVPYDIEDGRYTGEMTFTVTLSS